MCLSLATGQGPHHGDALQSILEVERGQGGREKVTPEDQSGAELSSCHARESFFLVLQSLPESLGGAEAWSLASNCTSEERQPGLPAEVSLSTEG